VATNAAPPKEPASQQKAARDDVVINYGDLRVALRVVIGDAGARTVTGLARMAPGA